MSPSTFQRVVFLVLGWHGLVLWLCGFASFLLATVFAFIDFWPDGLVSMALSAVAASVGFIMFTSASPMTTEEARRIPTRHLPAIVGFQLAAMLSGAIAIASIFATSGMLVFGIGRRNFARRNFACPFAAYRPGVATLLFETTRQ